MTAVILTGAGIGRNGSHTCGTGQLFNIAQPWRVATIVAMTKIKAKQIAFNRDPNRPTESHIAVVDTKNRIWERFSKMPIGEWSEIPLPDEPQRAENRRRRRASKPRP